jgi:hypothetical protein
MRKLLYVLALLLPGCATGAAPSDDAAPIQGSITILHGPVIYEVRSWGRILLRWQVNPDGTGEIWRGPMQTKDKAQISKYRLRLDGDALGTFVRNIEDVRKATQDGIPCDKEIFDLPYGSVTWDYPGAKQVYSFDAGCRSEAGDDAMDILGAASTVVETMAKVETKPYMTEPTLSR